MDISNRHRPLLLAPLTVFPLPALILLWLAAAGGGWGFTQAPVVLINLIIGTVLIIRAAKSPLPPFALALLPIIAALILSTLINSAWSYGPLKIMMWLAYLAILILARRCDMAKSHRAALLVLIIYTPLALAARWDNDNVIASNILFLGLLAWPGVNRKWALWGLLLVSMVLLQCLAGLLALLTAALVLSPLPHKRIIFAGLLGPLLLLGWWISPWSYLWRFKFYADALAAAWPWGVGPGNYYLINNWHHAHNTILNLIAENGLPGLLAVVISIIILGITWGRYRRPTWAAAVLAAFGLWCLVDDPTQILAPPILACLALTAGRKDFTNGNVQKIRQADGWQIIAQEKTGQKERPLG